MEIDVDGLVDFKFLFVILWGNIVWVWLNVDYWKFEENLLILNGKSMIFEVLLDGSLEKVFG